MVYRIAVHVAAIDGSTTVQDARKHIFIDPKEFQVETVEGLEAVIRAEAGHVAANLFRKVKESMY